MLGPPHTGNHRVTLSQTGNTIPRRVIDSRLFLAVILEKRNSNLDNHKCSDREVVSLRKPCRELAGGASQ